MESDNRQRVTQEILTIRQDKTQVPGGWEFFDPELGYHYQGKKQGPQTIPYESIDELISHIRRYREAYKKPMLENARLLIHTYLCNKPEVRPYCSQPPPIERNLRSYITGAMVAIKTILKGKQGFCSQEEAERRASICAQCPANSIFSLTSTQRQTDKVMLETTKEFSTANDALLETCGVCGCPLKAKVHFDLESVQDALTSDQKRRLPIRELSKRKEIFTCWMAEDGKEKKEDNQEA